jgi:hypothetical protein
MHSTNVRLLEDLSRRHERAEAWCAVLCRGGPYAAADAAVTLGDYGRAGCSA